jgi:hypothetical protein
MNPNSVIKNGTQSSNKTCLVGSHVILPETGTYFVSARISLINKLEFMSLTERQV